MAVDPWSAGRCRKKNNRAQVICRARCYLGAIRWPGRSGRDDEYAAWQRSPLGVDGLSPGDKQRRALLGLGRADRGPSRSTSVRRFPITCQPKSSGDVQRARLRRMLPPFADCTRPHPSKRPDDSPGGPESHAAASLDRPGCHAVDEHSHLHEPDEFTTPWRNTANTATRVSTNTGHMEKRRVPPDAVVQAPA